MFINDSFAETIDLNVADFVIHKHTPYVIILLKVADKWAKTHGGSLPSTREEKKEFKELIRARMKAMDEDNYEEVVEASFKVFAPWGISSNLQRIINDSRADVDSNSSDFWVMVATLKVHNNLASVTQVIDPKLHQHLETLGGGDYLFAFRMLMVLFRREFSFGDSLYLWEVWNYHFGEDNG